MMHFALDTVRRLASASFDAPYELPTVRIGFNFRFFARTGSAPDHTLVRSPAGGRANDAFWAVLVRFSVFAVKNAPIGCFRSGFSLDHLIKRLAALARKEPRRPASDHDTPTLGFLLLRPTYTDNI
jgi:hypothetical protein